MKILVMEVSKIDHCFIKNMLEKQNHEICVATNSFEALFDVAAVMPDEGHAGGLFAERLQVSVWQGRGAFSHEENRPGHPVYNRSAGA